MYRLNKLSNSVNKNCYHSIRTTVTPTSIQPSLINTNRLLNVLSKSHQLEHARQLFDSMPNPDEFTWNTIISAYANSGKLEQAKILFKQTPYKTSITWSSLISGYARYGFKIEPLTLFWEMQLEGHTPNQFTWGSVLSVCSKHSLLQNGEQIHAHAVKTRLDLNDFVLTGLIDMYAKCNRIHKAESLFIMAPNKSNHVLWTAMVNGYSLNGDHIKSIKTFQDMLRGGVEANQFTLPGVLSACVKVLALYFGEQVHARVVKSGLDENVYVETALIDMYAKCGEVCSARSVLDNMNVDDIVSWNSIIVGCVRKGFKLEALRLFQKMREMDMEANDFTYPSVLNSLACEMDLKAAESIHCLIVKSGFKSYQPVSNALVDMYAKRERLDYATKVFNEMKIRDVISWTSLVTGYANIGLHREAIELFCKMRNFAIYPDQFVSAGIISACAELTVLEFGRQVQANFIKSEHGFSLSVDNSLITMYAKCGCIEDSNRIFDSMKVRNVISWTAIIVGYSQNGRGKESVRFYNKMIASGTKPDFITFIGLLFACSHAGLLENGRAYFDSMVNYGIKPRAQHYACMIDLLGRSGKIEEAKELLNQMTVEPDATVYKALLSACRAHGDVKTGEKAAMSLLELEPHNAVSYVMLSNIYANAGKWEDAAKIRKTMKSRGLVKEPGCSWIEIKSGIHTFMSEDRTHPRTREIYNKVGEIMILIKRDGYTPDISFALHDTDENDKELGLAYHSEKLAIAFGLLTLPCGVPIRIFKNLRVCGDCHSAMKFISVIFDRYIVLRDSNCFHHFKQGACSCGNYW